LLAIVLYGDGRQLPQRYSSSARKSAGAFHVDAQLIQRS